MKIEQNKLNSLSEFLKTKWSGRTCPMCQEGNWIIQENCFQIMEFNKDGLVVGGQVVPIIPITCSNCTNTIFINAILAGVVKIDVEIK